MSAPGLALFIYLILVLAAPGNVFAGARPEAGPGERPAVRPGAGVQARPAPQPRAWVPVKSYDFGLVKGPQTLTYDFVVYNKGEADLVIFRVTPG